MLYSVIQQLVIQQLFSSHSAVSHLVNFQSAVINQSVIQCQSVVILFYCCDTVRAKITYLLQRINMVSYQVVRPVEVQMVIFIILVLDHNIVLPECGQDPLLPPGHLWR